MKKLPKNKNIFYICSLSDTYNHYTGASRKGFFSSLTTQKIIIMNKHEEISDSKNQGNNEQTLTEQPMDAKSYINSMTCVVAKSFLEADAPEY